MQGVILSYLKDIDKFFLNGVSGFIGMFECLIYGLFYNFDFDFLFKNGQWNYSTEETLQLFGLAFLGTFSMLLTIQAFQMIDPCICTVLRSQEIIFAYLFQAGLFHETIGVWNLCGSLIVFISGIMVSLEDQIMIFVDKIFGKYHILINNDNLAEELERLEEKDENQVV